MTFKNDSDQTVKLRETIIYKKNVILVEKRLM